MKLFPFPLLLSIIISLVVINDASAENNNDQYRRGRELNVLNCDGNKKALHFDETPCTSGLVSDVAIGNICNAGKIKKVYREVFQQVQEGCEWDFNYELRLITGTLDSVKTNMVLEELCEKAQAMLWVNSEHKTWTDIDEQFTHEFMDEYTEGFTFLNTETGNFKNRNADTNPMENRFYPTDEESYLAGQSIDTFYKAGARNTILSEVDHLNTCQNQAIMCCFGRDRQYGDNNGNCAARDCDDANPGDNSNICYGTDDKNGEPVPYPGDETIHCHGLAWSDDINDPSYQLRFNNFFYVLMHDHMYSRGYVGKAIDDAAYSEPMCGCVEDMPKVVRADCSQPLMESPFTMSLSDDGEFSISPGDLNFRLKACRGVTLDEVTGEVVNKNQNNDLASHVNALYVQGSLSETTRASIFETLVGHDDPDDAVNEEACQAAWDDETQGADYETAIVDGNDE